MPDGFKGYCFDANHQPQFTLEWEVLGTWTRYSLYHRGQIGPFMQFSISRKGKRIEHDLTPRSWIQHLYPDYPRLVTKSVK